MTLGHVGKPLWGEDTWSKVKLSLFFKKKKNRNILRESQSSLYVELGYPVGFGVANGSKSY